MKGRVLGLTFAVAFGGGWAQQPATTHWSKSPLAEKIRKLCPEIDESQLRSGWPLPRVASHVAMDRCFAISSGSPGKRLAADQIRAWQSKAEQSGVQASGIDSLRSERASGFGP